MRDRFGREIDYMRISVIDSCNLNCYYCNPQDNNKNCQAINILSVKKVLCIVREATRLGITHFRLTGGEPLLHPQLDEMVLQIKKIPGVSSVSLTTNAVLLAQHAKWLKVCNQLPWRQSIASLNLILTSNVWQQDHNGFTHQDPGFLDHIANKKEDVVRLYLPPDTNCLLSCFDHCIRSRDYVNVLVTSKHPRQQWLTMEQAVKHCTQGIGIWEWASNDQGQEPDVVMACCGDTPTLETLAAVTILRKAMPEIKIRVINVVDLMKLEPSTKHPHGLTDAEYDALFTKDKPIIFAFHGYHTLIHELTYRRTNRNIHVYGYQEEGTITTPFDMRVQNQIDRFNLVKDAIMHLPQLGNKGSFLIQKMNDKLVEHKQYIAEYGQDLEEIRNWEWHK